MASAQLLAGPSDDDPDEQFLRQKHIDPDSPALLALVAQQVTEADDAAKIAELIRQLGGDQFQSRERATQELISLGRGALPALQQAANDQDAEIARRARVCIDTIQQNSATSLAALRIIRWKQPHGAVAALLRYLPTAPTEEAEQLVWQTMEAMALEHGGLDPALLKALDDPAPARRAVAACLIARLGKPGQQQEARRRLTDRDATVRLRAAQGFLAAYDPSVIPVLIELLDQEAVDIAWQAEELLSWAAGGEPIGPGLGAATPAERQRCRMAWIAWWKRNGGTLDGSTLQRQVHGPGLCFIVEQGTTDRIWLCGSDRRARWQMHNVQGPAEVVWLGSNRLLVWEERPVECFSVRDIAGNVHWRMKMDHEGAQACQTLPNGNFLFFSGTKMLEVTPDGKVRSRSLLGSLYALLGPQRLLNGNLLGIERQDRSKVIEIDSKSGRVIKGIQFAEQTMVLSAQYLPHGHYLVVLHAAPLRGVRSHADAIAHPAKPFEGVVETDENGKRIRNYALEKAHQALPIYDGHVLALHLDRGSGRDDLGGSIVEIDERGQVVWELIAAERVRSVRDCLGLVRFGFHQHPRAGARDDGLAYRVALLKDPSPLMRLRGAEALAKMGANAKAAIPHLIQALDDDDDRVRQRVEQSLADFGSLALRPLFDTLRSQHAAIWMGAKHVLSQMTDHTGEIIEALRAPLKDPDPMVREHAVRTLGALGSRGQAAVSLLVDALYDPDTRVEKWSALSLGALGQQAQAAVPDLLDALEAPDIEVRCAAARALGMIGRHASAVLPALVKVLKDEKNPARLRTSAAFALGEFGDQVPAQIREDAGKVLHGLQR